MLSIKYLLLGIVCLFLFSCVTSQSDVDGLRHQLRSLERQQQQDMQDMTQNLQDYRARLEIVDEQISRAGGTAQTTQAALWADVESMKVQVATLTGRLDTLERQYLETRQTHGEAQKSLQDLKAKTRELDRSVHMISSQLGLEIAEAQAVPEPAPSPGPAQEPVPDQRRTDSAQALYQRALDSFYDRNYELAQALWQEFTNNFSDHALTSNAYFWQGESFFQLQEYGQAALAYEEVLSNFPHSNKISASMLKQGMSFFHLGREQASELVFNELISKFPDTAEARRAKSFMAEHQ